MALKRVGQQRAPGAVVVIEAIDYDPHPDDADERISFVAAYLGNDAFERRQLRDPNQWPRISADIEQAAQRLRDAGVRRAIVRGAMRLPVWFHAGTAFRDVRGFQVAGLQKEAIWSSEDLNASVEVQAETIVIGDNPDAAVAVGVAADPTAEVSAYITAANLPVGSLTSILPAGGHSPAAIPDSPTAAATAVAVRNAVRELSADNIGHPKSICSWPPRAHWHCCWGTAGTPCAQRSSMSISAPATGTPPPFLSPPNPIRRGTNNPADLQQETVLWTEPETAVRSLQQGCCRPCSQQPRSSPARRSETGRVAASFNHRRGCGSALHAGDLKPRTGSACTPTVGRYTPATPVIPSSPGNLPSDTRPHAKKPATATSNSATCRPTPKPLTT